MSKNKGKHLTLPMETGAKQSAQGLRDIAELCDRYGYIGIVLGCVRPDGGADAFKYGVCERDAGTAAHTALRLLLALQ